MAKKSSFTYKHKKILTIALFVAMFFHPFFGILGLIAMWKWLGWSMWIKILITLPFVITILAYLGVLTYIAVARPVQIIGDSMSPNLTHSEYYLNNVVASDEMLNRGDMIVFESPDDVTIDSIKRIIGLPNERVLIKEGAVYINGEVLDESAYLESSVTAAYPGTLIVEGEEYIVPTHSYFVLGDNRGKSADSRVFGAIPHAKVKSKVAFCYWNCWK